MIKKFFEHVIPFLMIGTLCALVAVIAIFVAHIIFWGLLIGIVLYAFFTIKNYFSPASSEKDLPGKRIIDHEE